MLSGFISRQHSYIELIRNAMRLFDGRPKKMKIKLEDTMYLNHYASPLGTLYLISDGEALTGLYMEKRRYCKLELDRIPAAPSLPVFQQTRSWLDLYFHGKEPGFLPELRTNGSEFQEEVWKYLLEIPYGSTTTYGDIAQKIARSRGISHMSTQAVGGAVGRNPISIIIPCHRVVGNNGSLTGYAGGIENKRRLLELENVL